MPHVEPTLSVIVPVYQGKHFISYFFEAWEQQSASKKGVELIMVDNNSSDGTYEQLCDLQSCFPELSILSYSDKQSSYATRNAAVRASRAPFLLFTDIDCRPQPEWLAAALSQTGTHQPKGLVAGRVTLFPEANVYNPFEWFDHQSFLKTDQAAANRVAITANLLVSRAVYDQLGGFRELTSGSDVDFSHRAFEVTGHFLYLSEMEVRHPARATRAEIHRKIDRVALGKAEQVKSSDRPVKVAIFAGKQIAALIIQHLFWKDMLLTWSKPGFSVFWKFQYTWLSLRFWSRYRIKSLLALLS